MLRGGELPDPEPNQLDVWRFENQPRLSLGDAGLHDWGGRVLRRRATRMLPQIPKGAPGAPPEPRGLAARAAAAARRAHLRGRSLVLSVRLQLAGGSLDGDTVGLLGPAGLLPSTERLVFASQIALAPVYAAWRWLRRGRGHQVPRALDPAAVEMVPTYTPFPGRVGSRPR